MRPFLSLALAALALSACTSGPVYEARMPVDIRREEGQAPRMGEVRLMAGSHAEDSLFVLSVDFDSDGERLGEPSSVAWTVRFGTYCRNTPGWLQSVLIGPDGQLWRGRRVPVPAGPDRAQDWSTGSTGSERYGGEPTPGLIEAMSRGGRFTLALENDGGERFNPVVVDTLTPARREALFARNVELVREADPAMPPRGERLLRVVEQTVALPYPPRPCP